MGMAGALKIRFTLLAVVLFLTSTYFSCSELRYGLWGKTAEATVLRVNEVTEHGRTDNTYFSVHYRFMDVAGPMREEYDHLPAESTDPPAYGEKVAVQYISGSEDASRLAGNSKKGWIWVFFGCLAVAGFMVYRLITTPLNA